MERRKNGRKSSGRKPTGRTAAGESGKEALLLGGNSADSKGKEGRGSGDFRAGAAKVFCGGEKGTALRTAEESTQERKTIAPIFTAEIFREKTERHEAEERRKTIFMQEAPFAEQEKRKTIPIVAETGLAEKAAAAEEAEDVPQEAPKKEREQAKGAEIDIERLMREMTKRLWEEREASGRRLRR